MKPLTPIVASITVLSAVLTEPAPAAGTKHRNPPTYTFQEREVRVDGKVADWKGVPENAIQGESHLWFGQGMSRDKWRNNRDLSYTWRGAWSGKRLCFLFEVTDDRVTEAAQPDSYLCDCVEIYLDPLKRGGARVQVLDDRTNWFDKCLPGELRGYELHFLPTSPPKVFLDHRDRYSTGRPHNEEFSRKWAGEAAVARTAAGYVLEVAFSVPDFNPAKGVTIGLETGVCDDDGKGRESIMMWTGTRADFWLNMDEYGTVRLGPSQAARPAQR